MNPFSIDLSFTTAAILASVTCLTAQKDADAASMAGSFAPGAVYTMTNETGGNRVALYDRGRDGVVTFNRFVFTGGFGTGRPLGNQGGLILTDDERFLLVCNAGSHSISTFRVLENDIQLVAITPAQGLEPVSVTEHDGLVYVVNDMSCSIAGFHMMPDGSLDFIRRSTDFLSGFGADPAQISFSPDGNFLFVTEKGTNLIDRYEVAPNGRLTGRRIAIASPGRTPFGFAFGRRNQMFLSEAFGGAPGLGSVSSLQVDAFGNLGVITPSSVTGENATCWVVSTASGRLIYASNTGTASISSYRVGFDGSLQLLDALAATTGASPLDMAISNDDEYFYVLNSGAGSIGDYRIEADGALTSLPGSNSGLPASASGLAAR